MKRLLSFFAVVVLLEHKASRRSGFKPMDPTGALFGALP